MTEHQGPVYAACVSVCALVTLQVYNGGVCNLLMAEVPVPCPLRRVVQASDSYKPREHMVSRGPLRRLGKRVICTL